MRRARHKSHGKVPSLFSPERARPVIGRKGEKGEKKEKKKDPGSAVRTRSRHSSNRAFGEKRGKKKKKGEGSTRQGRGAG